VSEILPSQTILVTLLFFLQLILQFSNLLMLQSSEFELANLAILELDFVAIFIMGFKFLSPSKWLDC
jgi:hypothetical protein